MNYNLTNRPKCKHTLYRPYEEWFKGFEAELRELLPKLPYRNDRIYGTRAWLIKEILGEERDG